MIQAMPPGFIPDPPVRRISVRHTLFKVAFGGAVLATVLFIVGFSAPAWVDKEGLWMICVGSTCDNNVGYGPSWLDAVRAMETLALICFLSCIAMVLYQDVYNSPPPAENKAVEILGGLAAVFGLIGISIYGAKQETPEQEMTDIFSHYYSTPHINFKWAFWLATAGSILILICSCLIAYSRVKHAAMSSIPAPPPSVPSMIPMQPMGHMQDPSHPTPYAYPYPYPYPAMPSTALTAPPVSTTPFSAPSAGPQADASRQAVPTSQIPEYYMITQGRPVPVFSEVPAVVNTAQSTAATPTEETTVNPRFQIPRSTFLP